jgi:hypothetical protein
MEHQPHLFNVFEKSKHLATSQEAATNVGSIEVECQREDPIPPPLGLAFTLPKSVATLPRITEINAEVEIGRAYDRIHRIQASLAYIEIMNINIDNPGFSLILYEAKHTYEQALSHCEGRNFGDAREFASASSELSLVLWIILSRALRSDCFYPTLVPMPHENQTTMYDSIRTQEELYRVEGLLLLIHRVAEDGALPSEDQTQILNIASCSERLLKMARQQLGFAEMQEAIDLIHAAVVTAHAAEHVCKRWYAMNGLDPSLPLHHGGVMCNEPSARDREYDGSSQVLDLEGQL